MSLMMETVITFFAAAFERDVMMASTEFFGFRLKKDLVRQENLDCREVSKEMKEDG